MEREQAEFQKKLIAGYKRDASRTLNSEDIMWEEAGIEDNE